MPLPSMSFTSLFILLLTRKDVSLAADIQFKSSALAKIHSRLTFLAQHLVSGAEVLMYLSRVPENEPGTNEFDYIVPFKNVSLLSRALS